VQERQLDAAPPSQVLQDAAHAVHLLLFVARFRNKASKRLIKTKLLHKK